MAEEGDDVMFGDGFFGVMLFNKPHPTDKDLIICMMKPTPLTKRAFGLDDADPQRDRVTGAYEKTYRKDHMVSFNRWKYGRSWLFYCDWEGKKTDIPERMNLEHLSIVDFLRRRVSILDRQVLGIFKEIDKQTNQPGLVAMKAERRFIDHYAAMTEGEAKKSESGEEPYR